MKLKLNDTIQVLTGDDQGRTGKIIKVIPLLNRVLVEGINTYKKHLKPQGDQKGGVVTLSRPIGVNKVALVCPHCHKPTRIGYSLAGKDKLRVCTRCRKPITTSKK